MFVHIKKWVRTTTKEEILKRLSDAVAAGKVNDAKIAAEEALKAKMEALDAINNGLVNGMSIVGDKYAAHQVYLPQVLMSAPHYVRGTRYSFSGDSEIIDG